MLKSKLAPETLRHIKARADFFFSEQCKRLGPITTITPVLPVLDAHSPVRKRGRPRKVKE